MFRRLSAFQYALPMIDAVRAGLRRVLMRHRLPAHLRAVARAEGMISLEEADLLYRLAGGVDGAGCIVEVGSFRGRSTVALALGAAPVSSPVFAIDPHEPFTGILGGEFGPKDRAAFFKAMLRTRCYEHVRLVNLSSEIVTPGWRTPVSLLWIDGDHSYEGVRRDWEAWKSHLVSHAIVAFDDSIDRTIGPYHLVCELIDEGELSIVEQVGKITALRRL